MKTKDIFYNFPCTKCGFEITLLTQTVLDGIFCPKCGKFHYQGEGRKKAKEEKDEDKAMPVLP